MSSNAATATVDIAEVESAESTHEQGMGIIKRNVAWSAGAGLVPVPLFDLAAVTGVQLKMINELCRLYGQDFSDSLARPIVMSLIGSLGAGVLAPVLAVTAFKIVPGIGTLMAGTSMAITSGAVTYAIGRLFQDHFEKGGNLSDFNVVSKKKAFKEKVEEGKEVAKEAKAAG